MVTRRTHNSLYSIYIRSMCVVHFSISLSVSFSLSPTVCLLCALNLASFCCQIAAKYEMLLVRKPKMVIKMLAKSVGCARHSEIYQIYAQRVRLELSENFYMANHDVLKSNMVRKFNMHGHLPLVMSRESRDTHRMFRYFFGSR